MAIAAQLNTRSIQVDSGVKELHGSKYYTKGRDRVQYACVVDGAADEAIMISETFIAQEKRAVKDRDSGERKQQYREKFVRRMYRIPIANEVSSRTITQGLNKMIGDFATKPSLITLENTQTLSFSARGVVLTAVEDSRDYRTTVDEFACSVLGGIAGEELRDTFNKLFLLGKFERAR